MTRYRCDSCGAVMETVEKLAPVPSQCPRCGEAATKASSARHKVSVILLKIGLVIAIVVGVCLGMGVIRSVLVPTPSTDPDAVKADPVLWLRVVAVVLLVGGGAWLIWKVRKWAL